MSDLINGAGDDVVTSEAGSGKPLDAPHRIRLAHRVDGGVHVFTSPDLAGFRVACPDLAAAFDVIEASLGFMVASEFGEPQPYALNLTHRDYVEQRYARHRNTDEPVVLFAARIRHARIHDPKAGSVSEARRRRDEHCSSTCR